MKCIFIPTFSILLISLVSCVKIVPVAKEQINKGEYGTQPTIETLNSATKNFLYEDGFFDPDTAKVKCKEPRKGWSRVNAAKTDSLKFGFLSECLVNAKNRMGGYTGYKPIYINYNNGNIVRYDKFYDALSGTIMTFRTDIMKSGRDKGDWYDFVE